MNVLVTGASGNGMGRSIALTLAREGHSIGVNFRTTRVEAEQVVSHITANGGTSAAFSADITDRAQCETLVKSVGDVLGPIDGLVINPGADWNPAPPAELQTDLAISDLLKEVSPVFNLMPLVLPGMIERGFGRIIALTLLPPYDSPAYSYNVAKAARASTMGLLARDVWGNGVTVNSISPGPISSIESFESAVEFVNHGQAWQDRENVSPQDVAEIVAFLCTDAARFVNGCDVPVTFNRG